MPGAGSFGIECPSGGKLYANNATAFLGCCSFDPATVADGLCTDAGIRPMAFDPDAYDRIPVQECAARSSSLWYSCKGTEPPFLGCCTQNPCIKGSCSKPNLRAAKLSSNERLAKSFLGGVSGTTTTSATASLSTATTTPTKTTGTESSTTTPSSITTPASTATPTPSVTAAAGGGSGGSQGIQPAVVAGMVVGIAAAAVAIALLIVWWMRRRRVAAKEKALTVAGNSPINPGKDGSTPWTLPLASPPDYSSLARGEKSVYAAELPGNVCFELPGESAKSPHGR
ncbi:uncharacterized protein BBA_07647 [Beauveria bassiana ARSEF 2860]|uniref:Uncharacterized protein n=1 Tax=Beauveria bassiana (strain ARSEF 2860) TaxID=655819 RepID=J5JJI1_BEAB2|nr:uncharacterized protein BBA_07647 [Beauveria bassiana ARSEF 2860]EJP63471.1 hypothetical protein BBA_07647 [Beauveria bassiana ARSEF 2860]